MIILHGLYGNEIHLNEDCIESFSDDSENLIERKWDASASLQVYTKTNIVMKSGKEHAVSETIQEIEQMISKEHPTNSPIQWQLADGKQSKFSYSTHWAEGHPTTIITMPQGKVYVETDVPYGRIFGLHVDKQFGEEEYADQLMSEAEIVVKKQGAKKIYIRWYDNINNIYMVKYAQMHGYEEYKKTSTRTCKLFAKHID